LSEIKAQLHAKCLAYIDQRIDAARKAIEEAQASANEETKSSAGDKYETGRAMMQIEIEKNSTQLAESVKLKRSLLEINPEQTASTVQRGSLVITDQFNYYIAIGAGQFEIGRKLYLTVSPVSPVGAKLIGLNVGQSFQMNGKSISIERVS
jgi:transcription elongation GreA/GreB family factor